MVTSTAAEWDTRADRLHAALLGLARTGGRGEQQHDGRTGLLWRGSREDVLRDLWPDAQGQSRTHPYGGTLSRKLAGVVVRVGSEDGDTLWWVALDRDAPARDDRQCPTCKDRFPSVQARRGHQASHRTGPRRLVTDADLDSLADRLAPRIADRLAALSPTNGGTR